MAMIKIVNKNYDTVLENGFIECEEINPLVEASTSLNMKCLPFLEYASDITFNTKQMLHITKEIQILREYGYSDQATLDLIKQSVELALNNHLYLKFWGD